MKKLYLLLALFLSLATADAQQWVGTFATAPEFTGKGDMPQTTTLANTTLRQVVKVSLGGSRLQVQLSNEFSREAVEIKSPMHGTRATSMPAQPPICRLVAAAR